MYVYGVEGTVCACDSTSECNNPGVSVCVGGSVYVYVWGGEHSVRL